MASPRRHRKGKVVPASRLRLPVLALGLALPVLFGCHAPEPARVADRPGTELAPCAERLHELSGSLLLYSATHGRLPGSLEELRAADAKCSLEALRCPISRKTYAYHPQGIPLPDGQSALVLFDAAPVHRNGRWAVAISSTAARSPLVARVVWVPETVVGSVLGTRGTPGAPAR